MTPTLISIILAITLIVLLGSGLWVAISLLTLGFIGLQFFAGVPSLHILGGAAWSSVSGWSLTPLPLFIWMGEILFHSRLSEDIFSGIEPWLRRLPGRLLHVNVFGSGLFAAVSGSSAATCATIGRISCPELNKRGYDEGMAIGSLTASGTLGLLIPPSITMIVYGVSAQVSIAKLFIAGIIPGLVLLAIFTTYIIIWALFNRQKMPPPEAPSSLFEKLRGSARLLSVVALILIVIGSIYAGIATPTEASAFGVVGAMLL